MKIIKKGEHLNIYHIGTMEEKSIKDVANHVADYFEREIEIKPGELTKGSTQKRCPDISKLKSLGFEPSVSFEDGVAKTAEWYNDHSDDVKKIEE